MTNEVEYQKGSKELELHGSSQKQEQPSLDEPESAAEGKI